MQQGLARLTEGRTGRKSWLLLGEQLSRSESVFDLVQSHRITAVIYVAAKLMWDSLLRFCRADAEVAKTFRRRDFRPLRRRSVAAEILRVRQAAAFSIAACGVLRKLIAMRL
jgi:hypothetical protein